MKASDLRIGNYYDCNGQIEVVNPNTITDVWESERTWCKPIPLSEDWLIRFGFKKEKVSSYGGADMWQGMSAYSYNGEWLFRGSPKSGLKLVGYFNSDIRYVHQLQNIFLALTGKELTIEK